MDKMTITKGGKILVIGVILLVLGFYSVKPSLGLPNLQGSTERVYELDWSSDGNSIAVAISGAIKIYDETFQELSLIPTEGSVDTLSLSNNGDYLAASIYIQETSPPTSFIKIWDVGSSIELATLDITGGERLPLAWNPNSTLLAFGTGREVFIWNRQSQEIQILKDFVSPTGLKWLSDSNLLVADIAGQVQIWDTINLTATEILSQDEVLYTFELDPTNQFLATNYSN